MTIDTTPKAASLDDLCRDLPTSANAFLLEDLVWEHFEYRGGEVIAEREENKHISAAAEHFGGVAGKRVLELGAYEGYHSLMLDRFGAAEVVSIEGNPRNFLKCLAVKNHYQMNSVDYLFGDCERYLAERSSERFDVVVASGVLYHLFDPIAALESIAQMTNNILICTTYFHPELQGFVFTGEKQEIHLDGMKPLVLYERYNTTEVKGKKHGMNSTAWMFDLETLLYYLSERGFSVETFSHHETEEPFHLRVQLFASRKTADRA